MSKCIIAGAGGESHLPGMLYAKSVNMNYILLNYIW